MMMVDPRLERNLFIVVNSIEPYAYETIVLLSLPDGLSYRARFESQWLAPRVIERFNDLAGHNGFILLRDFSTGTVYPLRFIRINRITRLGNIFYISYTVGPLVDYDSDNLQSRQQIRTFNSAFLDFNRSIVNSNVPGDNMRPLVFLTNYEPGIRNDHFVGDEEVNREVQQWGNVVDLVADIPTLSNVAFTRIVDVKPASPANAARLQVAEGFMTVKAGATYFLRVLYVIPRSPSPSADIPPADIRISSAERLISFDRASHRAAGNYDVLTFTFRVLSSAASQLAAIDVDSANTPKVLRCIDPRISIPISIARPLTTLARSGVLAALFAFLYMVPTVFPHWFSSLDPALQPMVRDLSLLGIALSCFSVIQALQASMGRPF